VSVGVISTLPDPTLAQVEDLAREAERSGADWLGVPDAFWWRDTWLLAASAARATTALQVGPVVTNPYLRHPFHTLAAIGTLQEVAGAERVLEVPLHAPRGLVAGERVEGLVPEAALRDVLLPMGVRDEARELYASTGARGVAVAAPTLDAIAPRVAWARAVLAP
jgi:hypothetical protein